MRGKIRRGEGEHIKLGGNGKSVWKDRLESNYEGFHSYTEMFGGGFSVFQLL